MEQYNITGMSCAACSARVEKAVSKLPGVDSCSVNLLTNSMNVEGSAASQEIIQAVEKAGYGASLKTTGNKSAQIGAASQGGNGKDGGEKQTAGNRTAGVHLTLQR